VAGGDGSQELQFTGFVHRWIFDDSIGRRTMKLMKNKTPRTFSYSVFCEHAPEGGYLAFVSTLPGCHTQGETLEETERNVKEAIALYLESLASHGGRDSRKMES
jgi:predicted RNase H-like HicB family nuclease